MLHIFKKAKDVVCAGFNRAKKVVVTGALVAATAAGAFAVSAPAAAHAAGDMPVVTLLEDTPAVTGISSLGITDLVGELVSVVQMVIGLLTKFPLNIFLAATIIFMGVKLFKSLKNS